ncbi:MAG: DUF3833 domain-containing protein [Gemmatimonadota bacterium]|nr:DUF3833 domain-containing protein [Gemmatimonadota bacterium]
MHSTRSIRHAAVLLACVTSAGCLPSLAARPAITPSPTFDPVAFFSGHTHGDGTLEVRFGKGRHLSVEGNGYTNADGSFQLDQSITYDDSTKETRRWVMRRRDATSWTATLSDAQGDVAAETDGNLFHLKYQIRSPKVYMEQWLYLQPDGRSVLNLAQVTVLGVPYAHLSETITRVGP